MRALLDFKKSVGYDYVMQWVRVTEYHRSSRRNRYTRSLLLLQERDCAILIKLRSKCCQFWFISLQERFFDAGLEGFIGGRDCQAQKAET